jgi:aryl-alcohol dehydrogenase-like predicted oxidoreductase
MAQMKMRVLGRSGLKVSEFCVGTMTFGAQTELAEAQRIADHAADSGVNFIDTANVYAKGRSEEVVGKIIKAKRDHWILASKLAQPTSSSPNDRGLSRRHMIAAADASLKRLGRGRPAVYFTRPVRRYVQPSASTKATSRWCGLTSALATTGRPQRSRANQSRPYTSAGTTGSSTAPVTSGTPHHSRLPLR